MLKNIKEAAARLLIPEEEVYSFKLNSHVTIEFLDEDTFSTFEIGNNDYNLKIAKENGIEPISFAEILDSIGEEKIENAVLIDFPGELIGTGVNRFRLIKDEPEAGVVTLQSCGSIGHYDGNIKPVTIARDLPMFTGLALQQYQEDERILPLAEVVERYKTMTDLEKKQGSNIYWEEQLFLSKQFGNEKQLVLTEYN